MPNHRLIKHACFIALLATANFALAQESELPSLGDSSSAIVSPEEEYKLGHGWLRQLRAHVRTIEDPVVSNYLDDLIYKLIINSQVQDRRFDLIVIDNDKLNAFAAPGGIIGIHSGLFTYANTEDEFASVMAHELAHLSQRHFARSIEEAKRRQLPTIVGILSSIALVAAGQGQAGMAALTGVQAANQQTALSFSRLHEQEADRVGMQTLANSDYNPGAMPDMFEHMQALYGRTSNVPEFLQTHPVTQSRIADTRNRSEQFPKKAWPPHPEYKLMQARIKVLTNGDYLRMIDSFKAGIRTAKTDDEKAGLQYGLACALLKAKRFADAQEALAPLLTSNPYSVPYLYTKADIYTTMGNPKAAIELLTPQLHVESNDDALTRAYIDALIKDKQYKQAEQLIQRLISSNEDDVWLWRRLVDVRQLSKQLPEWHIAKAQLLYLYAYYDQALQELKFAQKSSEGNYVLTSIIREKEKQVLEAKTFEEDNY